MVTNLAQPIQSDTQTFSVPELRQRTISRMTGAEMAAWDFTTKPINVVCTESGSGYFKGHFYVTLNDGTLVDTFMIHKHTSNSDGGSLYSIKYENAGSLIEWDKSVAVSPSDFGHRYATTGSAVNIVEDSGSQYTSFVTSNVVDGYCYGQVAGNRLYYAYPFTLQVKYSATHNTGNLSRIGLSTPNPIYDAAVDPQVGLEHCSSSNINIGVYSADGVSRQTSYIMDAVQSGPVGLRLDYIPSSKIIAKSGLGASINHTSNLPTISSRTSGGNLLRMGIRTTNTTVKELKIHAARLFGSSYEFYRSPQGWI